MIPVSSNPRYCQRPFPPYSYVPGSGTPHPVSDPRGHMYGTEVPSAAPLDIESWHNNSTYLHAVDLFNHGFYWEAHEAWEALWHAAGRTGTEAVFLKGLIKLAAAGVKQREGNPTGVGRHARRAIELLGSISLPTYYGIDLDSMLLVAEQLTDDPGAKIAPILLALPRP